MIRPAYHKHVTEVSPELEAGKSEMGGYRFDEALRLCLPLGIIPGLWHLQRAVRFVQLSS